MRLRALAAALAASPLALASCAETAQRGQQVTAAAGTPPIEERCRAGCLSTYYLFSSEAFGTGGLAELYRRSEEDESFYRGLEIDDPGRCLIHASLIGGGSTCTTAADFADSVKNSREWLQEFVAGWLAAYPTAKEAYLAIAAAALEHTWERYCNDLPIRALEAERVGETWYEMADRLGPEAADRAQQAGELLPDPDYERERLAQQFEGEGGHALPLIAPGYENSGEPLLTAMSCEGGER